MRLNAAAAALPAIRALFDGSEAALEGALRNLHLCQEQLAARVQLALGDQIAAQALVKAMWSNDDALTARINPQVAQYTGQAELAAAIQDGLAAKAAGHEDEATAKLGRAVQLANEAGNEEMTSRLKKVVEIDDAEGGTVRLKACLLYTSPSPRDRTRSRMPSSA